MKAPSTTWRRNRCPSTCLRRKRAHRRRSASVISVRRRRARTGSAGSTIPPSPTLPHKGGGGRKQGTTSSHLRAARGVGDGVDQFGGAERFVEAAGGAECGGARADLGERLAGDE